MKHLKFPIAADTGETLGIQLGRLCLGRGDATVRIFLLPDGLHVAVPKDCPFVHLTEDAWPVKYSGLGKMPNETP